MRKLFVLGAIAGATILVASNVMASQLIYRPISPSFGGDPLNGSWLLSQANAQTEGGGSPGFSIDFPDFGDIPQPDDDDDTPLPDPDP